MEDQKKVEPEKKTMLEAVIGKPGTWKFWKDLLLEAFQAMVVAAITAFGYNALECFKKKLGLPASQPQVQPYQNQTQTPPVTGPMSSRVFGNSFTPQTSYGTNTQTYPTVSPTGDEKFPGLLR